MKYLKIIAEHLRTACVYFTVAQLIITIGMQLSAQEGTGGKIVLFETEMILLGFSVAMALIQDVFKIKKLSFFVRVALHFLLCMAAIFLLFLVVTKQVNNVRSMLPMMAAVAAVYAIIAGIVILIRVIRGKRKNEEKEYKPMFSDSKKK